MTPEREEDLRRDSRVDSAIGAMLTEVFEALDDERIANAEQRCCECGETMTSAVGTQLKMWLIQAFDESVGVLTHSLKCAAWVKVPGTTSTRRIDENSPPCDCWIGAAKSYIRYEESCAGYIDGDEPKEPEPIKGNDE